MLTGTRYLALDPKGRIVIPAAFRQHLGATFVLTRAPGGCLLALTLAAWRRTARRKRRSEGFRAFFLSGAVSVSPDRATGRILIPWELREWAGIRRGVDVALAGLGSALAIAPRGAWDERLRAIETALLADLASGTENHR
jgi:MraZ protein